MDQHTNTISRKPFKSFEFSWLGANRTPSKLVPTLVKHGIGDNQLPRRVAVARELRPVEQHYTVGVLPVMLPHSHLALRFAVFGATFGTAGAGYRRVIAWP